ncbi:MAG: FecR domain-containing protein [Terriglobales bacterium]
MTHSDKNSRNHPDLDSAVNAMRSDEPSSEELRAAGTRVWQKFQASTSDPQPELIQGCDDVVRLLPAFRAGELSAQRALLVETHLLECATCRQRAEGRSTVVQWKPASAVRRSRRWPGFAVAAALVLAVLGFYINNAYFAIPAGARATVQSLDGTAYLVTAEGDRPAGVGQQLNDGDLLRTAAGSHAYVSLSDGSLVEVNERSVFDVKARGKNMTVDLDRGSVIVQAAKRTSGHLYVKTPDCRVAVTGTVFGVNTGVKGSRVSVIAGSVHVAFAGKNDVLTAGEQVSTGENMSAVPVADDIAWSRDLPKHLELLSQLHQLQKGLESVSLPELRYNSNLLARVPQDTLFYASLPNAGQALEDANRILQQQIQQSDTLRQWWTNGQPDRNNEWNDMVAKLRELSDFLGEEVVIVGFNDQQPGAVIADVRRTGLREFLETRFVDLNKNHKLTVVEPRELAGLASKMDGPIALLRQNEVVFSGDRDTLIKINAQFDSGDSGFVNTEFGQRIADAYSRGAGFFFAADLHGLMRSGDRRRADRDLARSGFDNMRYLVVEHRELNNVPENRLVLDFAGTRRGIASWLASPAPMGSLEFVSRNASVALSFIAEEPQVMLTDLFNMENPTKAQSEMNDINAKLNLNLKQDLAAHFGGDGVLALDGPVLPTPSWKFVIEVHDADQLEASLQTLVRSLNSEAQREGKPGLWLKTEESNGQRYYAVVYGDSRSKPLYYTFAAGYMIMGPDSATLMNAIQTRITGDSLARSSQFKALLPKDQNANYSFIAYQNLAPILQPLLSTVSGEQARIVQELAADSRPSIACGWGRENRIEAVSNSRLLGFDWLALGTLFSHGESNGTMVR